MRPPQVPAPEPDGNLYKWIKPSRRVCTCEYLGFYSEIRANPLISRRLNPRVPL